MCRDVALRNQALKTRHSCKQQEVPRLKSHGLLAANSRDVSTAAGGSKEHMASTVSGWGLSPWAQDSSYGHSSSLRGCAGAATAAGAPQRLHDSS